MKTAPFLAATLALLILASCAKDNAPTPPDGADTAFLSVKILKETRTRSSDEDEGAGESDVQSLYIINFDNAGSIAVIPGTSDYYNVVSPASLSPDAVKVSAKGTQLLIIANPGSRLLGAITALGPGSTYTSLNRAIAEAGVEEITDDPEDITKGFAMISSGDDSQLTAGQKMPNPLLDVTDHIKTLEDFPNEAAAKAAAEAHRARITIERLASKLEFKVKASVGVPEDAKFSFGNWTLDAVNSTFYPFAEKTMLEVEHTTVGGYYKNNFYTHDPNFTGKEGILYTGIGSDYSPVLVPPYTWMADDMTVYCIENTMDAAEQKYENATRLVIKGIYHPVDTWTGDWFSFAGIHYQTLAILQAAYAQGGPNLQSACDAMFDKIKAYATLEGLNLTGTDFKSLTTGDLSQIPNGGEVIKTAKTTPCIRWYQGGLNYYYYEIRHINETTERMAFGKYGVVRNNWYSISLAAVKGPGTPWYPDIENPGPGDPDPTDPIDESTGFLAVEVEAMPWIIWQRDIEI